MQVENAIAFIAEQPESGLEIRVNFGVFAGRDATTAELEELGSLMLPEVGEISVIGEERHELADSVELVLRQVRVAIPPDRVPNDGADRKAFCERLVGLAEIWARRCIENRHGDITEL
jgi:hypothetical protein